VETLEANVALYREAWQQHDPTRSAFEESAARSRLLASRWVAPACGSVERWVSTNVHGAPPFLRGFADEATSARVGPVAVETEAGTVVSDFARIARRDVIGGWLRTAKPRAPD
jgi:hypothetical protein